MVAAIANSLSDDDADKRLSVIEAGTGTGKTGGYLIAALPIARALKKTVVAGAYTHLTVPTTPEGVKIVGSGSRVDNENARGHHRLLQKVTE